MAPIIKFVNSTIQRPAQTKLRIGTEVFVDSKWIGQKELASQKYIFFGITKFSNDYRYSQCILYDSTTNQCCSAPIQYVGKGPLTEQRAFPQTDAEVTQGKSIVVTALMTLTSINIDLDFISVKSSFGTNAYSLREKATPIALNPVQTPPDIKGLKQQIQVLQSSVQSLQTKKNTTAKDSKAELKLTAENATPQWNVETYGYIVLPRTNQVRVRAGISWKFCDIQFKLPLCNVHFSKTFPGVLDKC